METKKSGQSHNRIMYKIKYLIEHNKATVLQKINGALLAIFSGLSKLVLSSTQFGLLQILLVVFS